MKPKTLRRDAAKVDRDERDYLEQLLTEQEAAALLGLSVRFLQNRRTRGGGPLYVEISRRCVRYRRRDLIAWLDALSKPHTSATIAPDGQPAKSAGRRRTGGSRRPTADPEAEERSRPAA
jgi:hypothetical protein